MAHPFFWPQDYFYPFGDTSAICLARDISPEINGNILLLGCGDYRNVLYTIHNEHSPPVRKLDFTCCDVDAAILARNTLLYTFLVDRKRNIPSSVLWDMCYRLSIDRETHLAIISQCKKLVAVSETLLSWNTSPYSSFIRICTQYTLGELRRHWRLYIGVQHLSRAQLSKLHDEFTASTQYTSAVEAYIPEPQVSPLEAVSAHLKSGLALLSGSTKPYSPINASESKFTFINPTLIYSLAGESWSLHPEVDPLMSFHLSPLFGNWNSRKDVTSNDTVKAAMAEFDKWCQSFSDALLHWRAPIIRLFAGEVTAVCRTMQAFRETKSLSINLPVAQWKTTTVDLSDIEYISGIAPCSFDVIDTSSLTDNIGLFNILTIAVPLLSRSGLPVLYTESLIPPTPQDQLPIDPMALSLIIDLCPVDILSGFSTRATTREFSLEDESRSFHQVTTWKPTFTVLSGNHTPIFDSRHFGTFLYHVYRRLFVSEDEVSNFHYTRESFVLFLKMIQKRFDGRLEWKAVMEQFLTLHEMDRSTGLDRLHFAEFSLQLHRYGVYTDSFYQVQPTKVGRFVDWDGNVPALVRVILAVPRAKIRAMEALLDQSTIAMQCEIRGEWSVSTYSAIHVSFGTALPSGSRGDPRVTIYDDPAAWNGESTLLVSFIVTSTSLADVESPDMLHVCLCIRYTDATEHLKSHFGPDLDVFSASLMDERGVFVLRDESALSNTEKIIEIDDRAKFTTINHLKHEIGGSQTMYAEIDDEYETIDVLTARISVDNESLQVGFGAGALTPTAVQVAPCVMEVTLGQFIQHVVYPLPINGDLHRLHGARNTHFIELTVPMSSQLTHYEKEPSLFPILAGSNNQFTIWNIHRLNLDKLPALDVKAKFNPLSRWLILHLESMISIREHYLRQLTQSTDVLMMLKYTLLGIFVYASGVIVEPVLPQNSVQPVPRPVPALKPLRIIAFENSFTKEFDMLLFVSSEPIKYDLDAHSVILEGYILLFPSPVLRKQLAVHLEPLLRKGSPLTISIEQSEMQLWKQFLAACGERCRKTWKHNSTNCQFMNNTSRKELFYCDCGKGKDVDGLRRVLGSGVWKKIAPHVTRVALPLLFPVQISQESE